MADTPDPVAETVQDIPPPPVPVKRASPLLPVLGGVVAAVLGFGLAQVVPNGWPLTGMQASLTSQSAQIATLEAKIAELDHSAALADLTARLTAVEGTAPPPDLAPLTARIDALDAKVAALAQMPASGNPVDLTELRAEVEAIKSGALPATATAAIDAKLAEADTRIAAIKSEAEAIAAAAARRAALRQIQAALDTGAPYGAALSDLGGVDLPALLTDNAAAGLPTLQSLRLGFPDAARLALEAALQANMGESWTDRIGNFLRGQSGARSLTPREGSDPDAILSRAEAAVATGDLTTALAELDALPPEAQNALSNWRAKADLRLQATTAVQGLLATAEM